VRRRESTNFQAVPSANRFSIIESKAVPALIAAVLFFMSGGDVLIISLAFVLLLWSLLASRRRPRRARPAAAVDLDSSETLDFLRSGIEWCQAMSGARRVILWEADEASGLVRPVAGTGGVRPNAHVLHGSPVTWVARERVAARLAPPPEWAETLRVIGVPVVQAHATHALTFEMVDDLDVDPEKFAVLGIYMGALLNLHDDHRVLYEKQVKSDVLLAALRALPRANDGRAVGQELLTAALRMTHGTGACVVAWGGERAEVVIAEGVDVIGGDIVDDPKSLTVLAARGEATLTRQGSGLRDVNIVTHGERLSPRPEAAVAIPLINQREVIGVLTIWTAHAKRVDESAITTLESLAPFAAVQLQQARELSAMRAMADVDALTGLANRRAFDMHLAAEWARWERYQRSFSLLLFDIDHFKSINDRLGHDGGDEVLESVAATLKKTLRNIDFAARYGGEEFAVILPETSAANAAEIAERLRARMEGLELTHRGQAIRVTVSGGVAAAQSHLSAADMVRAADQLLYRAKSQGRNRIATGS
jgi:diguanylate cyclase (GGDEF)-like protein